MAALAAGGAGAAAPPAAALDLAVEEVRHDKGLTLLLHEDHAAPGFTIMLWVPAGGRTERAGQSGISHYLEHCYSLGSSKLAPREIDRLIQALGGQKNAFTSHDYTAYYESLPAAALEKIVEVEADRLATLALPADRLASELDVVREERRLRYDDSPQGALTEKLLATAFERHPYRNPVIGWPEDLARMSRDDAVAYYRAHYAPANATYVLVGDFEREKAVALFRKHFGGLAGGARPAVAVAPEPEQAAERRASLTKESVKVPQIAMLWKVPGLDHPDTHALNVLEGVLLEGDAARCDRILRRERKLVQSVGGGHWEYRDPGPFTISAEALAGVPIEDVERAIDEVVAGVVEGGVSEAELERAKATLELAFATRLESTSARAMAIGQAHVTSAEGWRSLTRRIERLRAVTAEDVRRVAATYLRKERRTVVHLLPPAPAPAAAADPGEPFGEARRLTLPNGLVVLYQQVKKLPTVAISASVRAGGVEDPRGRAGLSSAVVALLKAGTATLDEEAQAERFAALGTALAADRGADAVEVSTTLLARDFEAGLALLADALRRPSLAADKLERVRGEMLAEKESQAGKPEELLIEAFYRAIYAGHPYELPLNGTKETLAAISLEDVRAFHAARYRPERTALAIVGDVDPARVLAAIAKAFGDWAGSGTGSVTSLSSVANLPTSAAPRLVIIDKPDQTQAHIRLGHPAIARGDPEYDALFVAHYVLGGAGLASRITDTVRTKNGLAYSAGTSVVSRVLQGPFVALAQTKTATAGRAVELMLAEIERVRQDLVPGEELERAKGQLAGSLPFKIETNAQKARVLLDAELFGLGPDHLRRQIERVRALTAEEVRAAAQKYIRPADLTIVVVAPRAAVEPQLARFGAGR